MNELHERLQILAELIAEQHAATQDKHSFILDSGAQSTHTATPHASMHPTIGTLTQTATGQRVRIAHTGSIGIQTRKNKIQVPAVHTPNINRNLLQYVTSHNMAMSHSPNHTPTFMDPPSYHQQCSQTSTHKDSTDAQANRHTKPKAHVHTAVKIAR